MAVPGVPLPDPVIVGDTGHATMHTDIASALNYMTDPATLAALVFASPAGAPGAPDLITLAAQHIATALANGTTSVVGSQFVANSASGATLFTGTGDGIAANLLLTSYNNVANTSPSNNFRRSDGSLGTPSDVVANDRLGALNFQGRSGASFETAVSFIAFVNGVVGVNSVPGRAVLSAIRAAGDVALTEYERWGGTEVVINEGSADIDFRVESDGNANALFVDANTNRIGLFNAAPNSELDLTGTAQVDALRIDQAPIAATPVPTHTFTINLNGTVYRIPCVV